EGAHQDARQACGEIEHEAGDEAELGREALRRTCRGRGDRIPFSRFGRVAVAIDWPRVDRTGKPAMQREAVESRDRRAMATLRPVFILSLFLFAGPASPGGRTADPLARDIARW